MKDNKLKLFSLILSAVLIAGGCAKDNTESGNHQGDQDSELPENVFNENVTQYFTEVTGSYIRVSSDIPDIRPCLHIYGTVLRPIYQLLRHRICQGSCWIASRHPPSRECSC